MRRSKFPVVATVTKLVWVTLLFIMLNVDFYNNQPRTAIPPDMRRDFSLYFWILLAMAVLLHVAVNAIEKLESSSPDEIDNDPWPPKISTVVSLVGLAALLLTFFVAKL